MQNIKIKNLAAMLFISSSTAMANSQLTIEPIFDNVLQIPNKATRLMEYKVINHDKIEHHFILKPIASVTQITTDSDDCQLNQTLQANQSCILKLQVSGTTRNYINLDGPALCESRNLNCIKPKKRDRLAVEKVPEHTPMISVTMNKLMSKQNHRNPIFTAHPCRRKHTNLHGDLQASSSACSMQLFANDFSNDTPSSFTVFNQSTAPISLSIGGSPFTSYQQNLGYSDDCDNLSVLEGNSSCSYYFIDSSGGNLPTGQLIVGSLTYTNQNNQTGSIPVSLIEFNIGNQYPCPCVSTTSCPCSDNYLFTLPENNGYNLFKFYTAAGSDISADTQDNQIDACFDTAVPTEAAPVQSYPITYLPGYSLLDTLWGVSNCNSGTVPNFTCGNEYWSSDSDIAISFADGSLQSPGTETSLPARCVNAWFF